MSGTDPADTHPLDCDCLVHAHPRATDRPPTLPAQCEAWPFCGREVTGACACAPVEVPTVPAPRPDPVRAFVALFEAHDLLTTRLRTAVRDLSREQYAAVSALIEERRRTNAVGTPLR